MPDTVGFHTKPELAGHMITAALDAGVAADFVTGDEVYGINPDLRSLLEDRGLSYVLAISCTTPVMLGAGKSTAEHAIEEVPEHAWQTRSAGAGAKGLRLYDWALVDLVGAGDGHRSLLARRNRTTGEIAYHLTWTPAPVSLQTLVTVAGMRWRIEECFQGAKELAALDEHQVRTWTSWHRWVTPRHARPRVLGRRPHPRNHRNRSRCRHDRLDLQRGPSRHRDHARTPLGTPDPMVPMAPPPSSHRQTPPLPATTRHHRMKPEPTTGVLDLPLESSKR